MQPDHLGPGWLALLPCWIVHPVSATYLRLCAGATDLDLDQPDKDRPRELVLPG